MEWLTVTELRERIDASAQEVVEGYFDKIERSKLNAYVYLSKEEALKRAREIDKGGREGPLAGIPVAIKDNISTKGIPTTCGSRILRGYLPPYDAHVIERLRDAGAIILGKTNMDEFAMGSSNETSCYGPARNPWDLDRVPGGSSGGSAAAVAGGEAPLSLGSDTGGSVRCPASFCGIVGLKPTYGMVSRYGLIAYANSLEQIGPLATNVKDLALLFDVISGYDPRDSTSVDKRIGDYSRCLVDDVRGLAIGVPREYLGEGVDEDVEKAVWRAVHRLEDLGASWRHIEMPHTKYALAAYYIIAMSEASSNLSRYDGIRYGLRTKDLDWHTTFSQVRAAGFGDEVKRRIILGTYALSAGYHERYYLKALKVRTLVKNDFEHAFKNVDILIAPTMPFPAFKIGERVEPLSLYLADVDTVPVNLAGVPSISVPCGFSDGLPIGMQIIGRPFDEATLLRAAYTFEENTNYHTRRPEVV